MDLFSHGLTSILINNGLGLEAAFIFFTIVLAFLFGIANYRIALIMYFVLSVCDFILFTLLGWAQTLLTVQLLFSFVIFAIGIYVSRQGEELIG